VDAQGTARLTLKSHAQDRRRKAMTDDDKALVKWLDNFFLTDQTPFRCDAERAARLIEAQAAEIERLREAGNDLGFYAGHEDACDCVKGWAKGPCNCGYTEAWQAWHNLEGKAEQ
jgi:hypothetical protein